MTQAAARADNTTIAAAPSTTPQSQLAIMAGTVPAINPQGETARFLLADVRGKDAASAYRLSVIRTAVLELLKGNPRNLKEAIDLSAQLGKGKKARAYAAGFAPLLDVQAIARTGKWMDSANADIRAHADAMADAYTVQFSSAYATVMAEKAAPKAKKATTPAEPAAPAADASASDSTGSDSSEVDSALLIESALATVITLAQQGMLSDDQVATLRAALAPSDAIDTDINHLLTASPVLLQAQAH